VLLHRYDRDFDDIKKSSKNHVLCSLLDTLPDVLSMKEWLEKNTNSELAEWRDRISPAALGILRWVVASCRACIMQQSDDERVFGMPGWTQFRFAMGAPDKERRFMDSVQTK